MHASVKSFRLLIRWEKRRYSKTVGRGPPLSRTVDTASFGTQSSSVSMPPSTLVVHVLALCSVQVRCLGFGFGSGESRIGFVFLKFGPVKG